jgi:hypothetical protein
MCSEGGRETWKKVSPATYSRFTLKGKTSSICSHRVCNSDSIGKSQGAALSAKSPKASSNLNSGLRPLLPRRASMDDGSQGLCNRKASSSTSSTDAYQAATIDL